MLLKRMLVILFIVIEALIFVGCTKDNNGSAAVDASISFDNTNYSEDQLLDMALDYYEKKNDYRPDALVDSRDGDEIRIHLFDDMGDHLATCAWYDININTGKGVDTIFGEEIDLTETSK